MPLRMGREQGREVRTVWAGGKLRPKFKAGGIRYRDLRVGPMGADVVDAFEGWNNLLVVGHDEAGGLELAGETRMTLSNSANAASRSAETSLESRAWMRTNVSCTAWMPARK